MPRIKPAKVTVEFLDPIDPAQLDKEPLKNIGGYVGGIIEESYASIRKESRKKA